MSLHRKMLKEGLIPMLVATDSSRSIAYTPVRFFQYIDWSIVWNIETPISKKKSEIYLSIQNDFWIRSIFDFCTNFRCQQCSISFFRYERIFYFQWFFDTNIRLSMYRLLLICQWYSITKFKKIEQSKLVVNEWDGCYNFLLIGLQYRK